MIFTFITDSLGLKSFFLIHVKKCKKRRSSSPPHKEKEQKGSQASQAKRVLLLRERVGGSSDGAPQMPPHGVLPYILYMCLRTCVRS